MREIDRLKKIIEGLEAKIEKLSTQEPVVTYDPNTKTLSFDGLDVIKKNKKSLILRDSVDREYMFRCTEHIDGITKGKRVSIVEAV